MQGDAQGLPLKGASNVRVHPFLGPGHGLLVFFIADTVFQLNDQMAFGFGHLTALGLHHKDAFSFGISVVVNQKFFQPSVRMLGAHPDGEAVDAVVEDALTEVEGGLLFGH